MSHFENESDDEPLELSSHALDALKEFYADRDSHKQRFANLQSAAMARAAGAGSVLAGAQAETDKPQALSIEAFTEDWGKSQFWYADETARLIASKLLEGTGPEDTVAVISVPSVFVALKNLVAERGPDGPPPPKMVLLEYDNRFNVFPEFVFYDFNKPVKLPLELKGTVTRFACDPPYLTEDCQTKAAMTVRWLAKPDAAETRAIICTGERMKTLVTKLYRSLGVQTTTYDPVHARCLNNEFYCYANFNCEEWTWRTDGDE